MNPTFLLLLVCVLLGTAAGVAAEAPKDDAAAWTIYLTNDNCPDYTWGLTEDQTRQAFADIVRGHLDEMNRTDSEPPENQDRYNMAVTQEALAFVEKYPQRKEELIRRIREGRVYVSPYLCNSLWALQSAEAVIRTFYPARRLEREWGIPKIEVAEHIEEPSLPWGTASLLAGCGIRWLSSPFYGYDSTFSGLKNPPLFALEGPDGSLLRVVMDPWACHKASYAQGAQVLRQPQTVMGQWLPHYRSLGAAYPGRAILASGTHSDINPGSGNQARGFAESIVKYNASPGPHPKIVNATVPMFCRAVDEALGPSGALPVVRGCFGHSWDLWPVSLAKYVADMREGERRLLAAEALLAVAGGAKSDLAKATQADRERAEWAWAMLSDHAWNGTDDRNKRHNADLRKKWSEDLNRIADALTRKAWEGAGLAPDENTVTIFNPLSVPHDGVVRLDVPAVAVAAHDGKEYLRSQVVEEDGRRAMYVVLPSPVPGFGLRTLRLMTSAAPAPAAAPLPSRTDVLRAAPAELESPFYRLTVDPKTGGIASLVWKPKGVELVAPAAGRTLCQTVYVSGKEQTLADVKSEVVAEGPVLARLKITGTVAGIGVTTFVTVTCAGDRVDFDVRVSRPVTTAEERLCHVFPVMRPGSVLRIETPGAVVRPRPQPEGDLLAGADTRRFAVQGFVDVSMPDGPGVAVVPVDAFFLRADPGAVTFEALGNDQNYKEVTRDQHGVTEFRFRYALRVHAGPYNQAEAVVWSRIVGSPLVASPGRAPRERIEAAPVAVDPARAIATCLKPADDPAAGGVILRVWETAGKGGPLTIRAPLFKRAVQTDLLERDLKDLPIADGAVTIDVRPHGFAAVRLLP